MEDESLTLQETADRLGVHYMTVYRWVRTGLLPAVKDDGVWRVRADDADARAASSGEAETEKRPRRRIDHGARLSDRLLAGDEAGSVRVVDDAMAGGVSAEDLSLGVITGAMRTVGEAWANGDATIADEHRASVIATRLVGHLAPHFTRRGRKRGTIVLGAVSDDHHGLPVALLAGPLRGRGHRVIELGANTPPEAFVDAMRRDAPIAAVGLFSAFSQEHIVAETIAAVRDCDPDVPVILGGAGVADSALGEGLEAMTTTADGGQALEALTARRG